MFCLDSNGKQTRRMDSEENLKEQKYLYRDEV